MGFMDWIRGESKEEPEESWNEDWEGGFGEDEFEFDDDDWEEEPEEEEPTWDTAYQFADEALQSRGFSGVMEFVQKAMVYEINRDPDNRDRFKVGQQTMAMVSDTMSALDDMHGGKSESWEEKANKLESARRIKDEIDKFQDKEEQMVHEITGLVGDFIDAYAERGHTRVGNVNTGMRTSDEEL